MNEPLGGREGGREGRKLLERQRKKGWMAGIKIKKTVLKGKNNLMDSL